MGLRPGPRTKREETQVHIHELRFGSKLSTRGLPTSLSGFGTSSKLVTKQVVSYIQKTCGRHKFRGTTEDPPESPLFGLGSWTRMS